LRILDSLFAELYGHVRLLAATRSIERLMNRDNGVQKVVDDIEVRKGG
jgi:hypothetical protein